MRLTTIKLAGFKSFVDPTTLHLPTNMTGVVGPNGCGKSNIIDAIRWVMGESAASRLRGDSLTDVIFSGSNARKPVGQATVELIFDNADGTIQGEYGQYAEISVKRQVTRDGQSAYFLNGARCRRRDITDLFLGTGLGPRSYSIIEQGMISQIVEAAPDELRMHLEEAAGISKYKERRKETESRIKATRENLDRVRDVRDEVDKQLEHLNRQARAAERWKALKEEQTRKEAELRALEYRGLKGQHDGEGAGLSAAEIEIERQLAGQRHVEAQLESVRERHTGASEHLNAVQAEVYKVGAEIARVEQQVRYNRETADRLQRSQGETEREHAELAEHIANDRTQVETLRMALAEGEPRLEALQQMQDDTAESLRDTETKLADWQQRWDCAHAYTQVSPAAPPKWSAPSSIISTARRSTCRVGARRWKPSRKPPMWRRWMRLPSSCRSSTKRNTSGSESLGSLLDQHKTSHEKVLDEERQVQSALNEARQQLQICPRPAVVAGSLAARRAWSGGERRQRLAGAPRAGQVASPGRIAAGGSRLGNRRRNCAGGLPRQRAGGRIARAGHPSSARCENADVALVDAAEGGANTAGTLAAHVRGPAAAMAILGHVLTADSIERCA